jgi:hypothetical protein
MTLRLTGYCRQPFFSYAVCGSETLKRPGGGRMAHRTLHLGQENDWENVTSVWQTLHWRAPGSDGGRRLQTLFIGVIGNDGGT